MNSTKRPIAALSIVLATAFALTACTNASAKNGAADQKPSDAATQEIVVNEEARALLPADLRDKGILTIASDPSYAPFEYFDTDNKTMIGFDIDLTDHLAASLGLTPEHQAATFDTILPGLASGKYDVGMSSFGIRPERMKVVDFVPYLQGGTALGVAKHNPLDLRLQDNSLCGRTVGAQNGSIQALIQGPEFSKACTDAGKQAIDLKTFPSQSDTNLALTSGRVEAMLSTGTTMAYQGAQAGDKFEVAGGPDYQPSGVGMAVKKDSKLTEALRIAMRDLIDDPSYAKLYTDWKIPANNMLTTADFDRYIK